MASTNPADPATDSEAAVMLRNGITLVTATQYHVDGYRYGHLAGALAQVRRSGRVAGDRS